MGTGKFWWGLHALIAIHFVTRAWEPKCNAKFRRKSPNLGRTRNSLCVQRRLYHPNMATELTVQSERAFQKQPHIFVNHKSKKTKSNKVGKGGRRWYKDVGLGFKTPKTAIEGTYIGMSPKSPTEMILRESYTFSLSSYKTDSSFHAI